MVENWAVGGDSTPLGDIVYGQWDDAAHMGNMLHPDVVHVGAGVTAGDGYVYYIMNFGVEYGSDPEKVRSVVLEALAKIDTVLEDPAPVVHFMNLGDSSLDSSSGSSASSGTSSYP